MTNFQLIGKNLLLGITNIPIMSLNPNQLTELELALDLPPKAASLSKSSLTKININHNVNLLARSAYEATKSATDLLIPPSLFDDPEKGKKKVLDKDSGHGVITLEVGCSQTLILVICIKLDMAFQRWCHTSRAVHSLLQGLSVSWPPK